MAQPLDKTLLLSDTVAFLFDCDGVIWRGDHLIEGVSGMLDMLRQRATPFVFLTNNSTRSRASFAKKFHQLGLDWVTEDMILTSAYAAADCLRYTLNLPTGSEIYVVGEQGILDELHAVGYTRVLGGPADKHSVVDPVPETFAPDAAATAAVVVGFDRFFNYHKLARATASLVTNPECLFVATNRDARAHLNRAQEWPGGGTMVAAVATAAGRQPFVAGKPEPHLLVAACRQLGLARESATRICMVGDRLDTDIAFGNRLGMRTLLVRTGVTDDALLEAEGTGDHCPMYVTDSVADLVA